MNDSDLIEQLDRLESFLGGTAGFEGTWFGEVPVDYEYPVGIIPRYWWRSSLLHPILQAIRERLKELEAQGYKT